MRRLTQTRFENEIFSFRPQTVDLAHSFLATLRSALHCVTLHLRLLDSQQSESNVVDPAYDVIDTVIHTESRSEPSSQRRSSERRPSSSSRSKGGRLRCPPGPNRSLPNRAPSAGAKSLPRDKPEQCFIDGCNYYGTAVHFHKRYDRAPYDERELEAPESGNAVEQQESQGASNSRSTSNQPPRPSGDEDVKAKDAVRKEPEKVAEKENKEDKKGEDKKEQGKKQEETKEEDKKGVETKAQEDNKKADESDAKRTGAKHKSPVKPPVHGVAQGNAGRGQLLPRPSSLSLSPRERTMMHTTRIANLTGVRGPASATRAAKARIESRPSSSSSSSVSSTNNGHAASTH